MMNTMNIDKISTYILNNLFISEDLSLQTGRFGLVMYLYHAGSYTGDQNLLIQADNELADIFRDTISQGQPLRHISYCSGIYWGICKLVNEGLVELDIDELFKEIDDSFSYRLQLHRTVIKDINIAGLASYLVERYKCAKDRHAKIMVIKSLIEIVDEIDDQTAADQLPINQLCSYQQILMEVLELGIYDAITSPTLNRINQLILDQSKTDSLPMCDRLKALRAIEIAYGIQEMPIRLREELSAFLHRDVGSDIAEEITIQSLLNEREKEGIFDTIAFKDLFAHRLMDIKERIMNRLEHPGLCNLGLRNNGLASLGLMLIHSTSDLSFDWRSFDYFHRDTLYT